MIEIIRADIATLNVDAIVNPANEALMQGGGACGAIHQAAGPELAEATRKFGGCATGGAVITPGFKLPAHFVIHAVGPIWKGGGEREAELLRAAYRSAFAVAMTEPSIRSIAFPAISTGIFAYPKDAAAAIAVDVMRENEKSFDQIVACLYDDETMALYERLLDSYG